MADERQLSDDEILEAFRRVRIADFAAQTLTMLSSLAYAKLESGELDEARLAIEAMRALLPAVREALSAELARDLDQVVANLQLAYAAAAERSR